jgi:hypothetical protein
MEGGHINYRLVIRFPEPEIESSDNRIPEFIPPGNVEAGL